MRLTIVTPTLDAARWLGECLASVRRDAREGVEIQHLIVDAGSSDDTVGIAERGGAEILHAGGRGLFHQINRGYESAAGDVIGYLGGDDTLLPGAVEAIRRWYEQPDRSEWLTGTIRWTDATGRSLGDLRPPPAWLAPAVLASLGWSCLGHQSTVVTPRLFREVGGFDESFRYVGDHDFFIRALERFPSFDRTPVALATFRRHGDNVSMSDTGQMRREMERILREHAPGGRLARAALRVALKVRLNAASPSWFIHKKAPALGRHLPRTAASAAATHY